jgi:16S rRNA (guanine966-N2)-methyltransferase
VSGKTNNKVRVTSGSAGGLWISIPKNFVSRPTQDRVKQAIFSYLGMLIPDSKILDLYAGSGSLGIEALSRGAASAVFTDDHPACIQAVKDNLAHCKLTGGQVIKTSAEKFVSTTNDTFDLIFIDPPYEKNGTILSDSKLLPDLKRILSPNGLIIWEHHFQNDWNENPYFNSIKTRNYGGTTVSYLSNNQ